MTLRLGFLGMGMWGLRFGGGSVLKKGAVVRFDRIPSLSPRSGTSGGPCCKRTAVGSLYIGEVLLMSWERGLRGLCGVRVSPSLGQKCELQGSVAGRARLLKGLQKSYWCVR